MVESGITPGGKLKVLLVGNYNPDRQQSMQRYARELARGLSRNGADVTAIRPSVVFGKLSGSSPLLGKWLGYIDKYAIFFPLLFIRKSRYDIVHITDHANAVYARALNRDAVVVTCHDLFAVRGMLGLLPEHRPRSSGRMLQRLILAGLRRCPAIVCVSDATVLDVKAILKPDLLDMIPNAIADDLGTLPRQAAERSLVAARVSGPYFLHVGGNQFYKNRPGVVRVFDELAEHPDYSAHTLLLAGKAPDALLLSTIENARHRDRIRVLVSPDDTTVQALYALAEALLFLSTAEGFGWPIVEAQACGCVVVTTDRRPMSDVGGPATILVDPADAVTAADTIVRSMKDKADLLQKGLENAEQYRAERVYGQYLDFYRRVLEKSRIRGS
jgi:glycosyltransferase involved in cell wall biosynthesis